MPHGSLGLWEVPCRRLSPPHSPCGVRWLPGTVQSYSQEGWGGRAAGQAEPGGPSPRPAPSPCQPQLYLRKQGTPGLGSCRLAP